jgi:RHH-type transcriptional regulator, rel operon repressor / antitoxin RelB
LKIELQIHTARPLQSTEYTLGRKKSAEKLKVVAVRVDPAIERRLRLLADTTGRKPSYFLQQLIEGGLGALEEQWLPADVLAQVRAGTVPDAVSSHSVPDLFGDME